MAVGRATRSRRSSITGHDCQVFPAEPGQPDVCSGVPGKPHTHPGGVPGIPAKSRPGWTFFAQGFTFTDGRIRGCVPLTIQAGRKAQVRHVSVSL